MSLSKFFPCFQFRLEDNINKLDYSNNSLTEGFPHVWQYERTLEELNVTSTRINYLPPQLFYCQALKVLLANNNNLESIPEAVGSLRHLQQLNLSRNFISNVPDNIKSCKNLTHLDLSCNSLQKLPDAITCLISLQELILNETYLEFLPANFGRLVNLRIVELRSNNLVSLPKSMQRLTNLQRLDIGCNEFTKMPEVVGELKQLHELWFDFNQIQTLPPQIGKLRELTHCEANGNCLRYLPNDIGNWHNVEVFSLSMNNLTTFPYGVGMLKSLVTLKCESNELTELPDCISKLENLEELVVSHNKLVCLPSTIGLLRKLRYLFADDNKLHRLPDDICSCSVLTVVSVSRNKLSALPDNIGHLKNLRVLNIVQNNIATFPVSLLSLVNLTSLWINNNQSQPLIPLQYTEISETTHLTCFMLPQFSAEAIADPINIYSGTDTKSTNQIERFSDKAAACNISKRRICFAAETTILQTDPKILPAYCENGNYFALSKINNTGSKISGDVYGNNEIQSESADRVANSKDFLMRSPTPYPKELRLMAKNVQANHQKALHRCNNDNCTNHTSIFLLEAKCDVRNDESNCGNNKYVSRALGESKNCDENIFHNSKGEINRANVQYSQLQCQSIEKENYGLASNSHHFVIADNSPKPPPYFIARCFTKKSAEDLTRYEFVRKQQEQHQYQHCKKYIDSNTSWQQTDNDPKNEVKPHNINFEYQNNLVNEKFEQKDTSKKHNGKERTEVSKSVTTVRENKFRDVFEMAETSKNLANRKCNISRTKWLFGAHKNPRVIQVNVNWENGRDFEIDKLPNKEGIFVVSTVSKSNASQLIHPLDKLLEVEGVDFTNIGINEARQFLENSHPSLSIMLSRK